MPRAQSRTGNTGESIGYPLSRRVYGVLGFLIPLGLLGVFAWAEARGVPHDDGAAFPWLAVVLCAVAWANLREARRRLWERVQIDDDTLWIHSRFPAATEQVALRQVMHWDLDRQSAWSAIVLLLEDGRRIEIPHALLLHHEDFRARLIAAVDRLHPALRTDGPRARWALLRSRVQQVLRSAFFAVLPVLWAWFGLQLTLDALAVSRDDLVHTDATVVSVQRTYIRVVYVVDAAPVRGFLRTSPWRLGAPDVNTKLVVFRDPRDPLRVYTRPPLGGWLLWGVHWSAMWLLCGLSVWMARARRPLASRSAAEG